MLEFAPAASDPVPYGYHQEDVYVKQANYSVQKMFKVSFLMLTIFFCNPFIVYLIFKNKGAFEISYVHLLQIYGYSFAIFVPVAFIYSLAVPMYNLRIFMLLASGAINVYYLYKETRELITKYFDDNSLKSFGIYIASSTLFFLILFRYYFIKE